MIKNVTKYMIATNLNDDNFRSRSIFNERALGTIKVTDDQILVILRYKYT